MLSCPARAVSARIRGLHRAGSLQTTQQDLADSKPAHQRGFRRSERYSVKSVDDARFRGTALICRNHWLDRVASGIDKSEIDRTRQIRRTGHTSGRWVGGLVKRGKEALGRCVRPVGHLHQPPHAVDDFGPGCTPQDPRDMEPRQRNRRWARHTCRIGRCDGDRSADQSRGRGRRQIGDRRAGRRHPVPDACRAGTGRGTVGSSAAGRYRDQQNESCPCLPLAMHSSPPLR
jgi:hypothetical protein